MRLVRYTPLNDFTLLKNSFNDFFTDPIVKEKSQNWQPAVDIFEEGDSIVLNVDLPGVKKEDIQVKLEEKVLIISGQRQTEPVNAEDESPGTDETTFFRRERIYGSFSRSFTLSPELLPDNENEVDARVKDGILTIILKKNKVKETVKQITIN